MFRFFIFWSLLLVTLGEDSPHQLGVGFWDSDISPNTVCIVPFNGAYISIWEDVNHPGRYYASPLVDLNEKTAVAEFNTLTETAEMRFEVIMWSLEAHKTVIEHLRGNINSSVSESDLELMPMFYMRMLHSLSHAAKYKLDDTWRPNTHLAHLVSFKFTCTAMSDCITLRDAMINNPAWFGDLRLEFKMKALNTVSRKITIRGDHIRDGKLFTKLLSMTGTTSSERYLTAEDMKMIISDTTHNVVASVQTDKGYVVSDDELSLKELLEDLLEQKQVESSTFEPHMWDSVFWDPDWARPDKLTSYLNDVLTKDEQDDKLFILNEGKRSNYREGGGSAGASFFGIKIGGSASYGSTSTSQHKIQIEDFTRHLAEHHSKVQFTGEFFRTKPLLLYRINLSKLSASTDIVTTNIRLENYVDGQSVRLRVMETGEHTMMLTPKILENRLNAKLDDFKQQLNKTVNDNKLELTQRLDTSEEKLTEKVETSEEKLTEKVETAKSEMKTLDRGTTYVRWGRTKCPNTTTELVYDGYTGGSKYNIKGGGSDLICLSRYPEFNTNSAREDTGAWIQGSEYRRTYSFFNNVNLPRKGKNEGDDEDVPCAVCRTKTRPSKVMIPGRKTCHGAGWTREYWGYIMKAHDTHGRLNHVCVDIAPEAVPGGSANHEGALIYIAQASCGSLKCPPYVQGYEITCVVCTK